MEKEKESKGWHLPQKVCKTCVFGSICIWILIWKENNSVAVKLGSLLSYAL